ncbi:MAG: microviridin/marinostatin family tricyclic proteinase inhibitor [Myxococcota bacterium]
MPPLRPSSQQLLLRALRAAEKYLAEHPKIDERSLQALPAPMQRLMSDIDRMGPTALSQDEFLGLFERRLRKALGEEAEAPQDPASTVEQGLREWLSHSTLSLRLGTHVDQVRLMSYDDTMRRAERVFARARPTVASQVEVLEALALAWTRAKQEAQPEAATLGGLLFGRQEEVRRCVEHALHEVRAAHDEEPQDETLAAEYLAVIDAAVRLCRAVDPEDPMLPTLQEERRRLTSAGVRQVRIEPFFERFLERQHAGAHGALPKDVTMRFPSDESDPGRGSPDRVMVTMKFPSDAEDGGAGPVSIDDRPPVTMRFPSDVDDGSVDHTRGGVMVTLKFPSDHEDGGTDGAGVRVALGQPSDIEAAPPPPLSDIDNPAARLSSQLAGALWLGPVGVTRLIATEKDLLTRVRLTQPALLERQVWLRALEALSHGGPAVTASLEALRTSDDAFSDGVDRTPEVRDTEVSVLEHLDEALREGLLGAANHLAVRQPLTEADAMAAKVLVAAWQGPAAIEERLEQLHHLIPLSQAQPAEVLRLAGERELLQTYLAGGAALEGLAVRLHDDAQRSDTSAMALRALTASAGALAEVLQALEGTRTLLARTSPP